ncbi:hypothetical protein C0J52_08370 [Blattella germanica]|nr:hypothetical protein C0J52_08370 [Blattella germanica]
MTLCTALILYESYSAIIISFLTIQKQDLPFTDFRTLIDNGHYKLGIAEHNAVIFEAATNPLLKETYEKMIMNSRNDLPADEPQGFTYLCQKDNYAYITAQFFHRVFRKSITCDLVEIPAVSIATYGSIIVDKSLPYIGLLNKR